MTYLSVKALRHYHEVGLLEPAVVEPATGYRRYWSEQVPTGQVIRRLRDLGMPLDDLRSVPTTEDVTSRNAVIVDHLRRMGRQLDQAQATVSSLRALLEQRQAPIQAEFRIVPSLRALAVSGNVAIADTEQWRQSTRSSCRRSRVRHGVTEPADRMWLAALPRLIPRHRWREQVADREDHAAIIPARKTGEVTLIEPGPIE